MLMRDLLDESGEAFWMKASCHGGGGGGGAEFPFSG